MIAHAGLIARRVSSGWQGVLIEGPSGSGKSTLALRALEAGWRLVADDRVLLWTSGGGLYGRAPDALSGLVEARGVGVLREPALPLARIALAVACAATAVTVERLPDSTWTERLGIAIPALALWPFDPAALAKLSRAADHLGAGR